MATRLAFAGRWTEKCHNFFYVCVYEYNKVHFKKLYYVDILAKVSSVVIFRRCCSLKSRHCEMCTCVKPTGFIFILVEIQYTMVCLRQKKNLDIIYMYLECMT